VISKLYKFKVEASDMLRAPRLETPLGDSITGQSSIKRNPSLLIAAIGDRFMER
jgi:hypothetical protein